jgi:hypothetical protein
MTSFQNFIVTKIFHDLNSHLLFITIGSNDSLITTKKTTAKLTTMVLYDL